MLHLGSAGDRHRTHTLHLVFDYKPGGERLQQ